MRYRGTFLSWMMGQLCAGHVFDTKTNQFKQRLGLWALCELDEALGGDIPLGKLTEVIGPLGSATRMCLHELLYDVYAVSGFTCFYNFNYMNMQQSCTSGPCLIMFYDTALRVCCGLIATKTYYSCMLLLIMFCLETLRGSLDSFPLGVNSKYYANLKLTTYFLWSNLIILLYI